MRPRSYVDVGVMSFAVFDRTIREPIATMVEVPEHWCGVGPLLILMGTQWSITSLK